MSVIANANDELKTPQPEWSPIIKLLCGSSFGKKHCLNKWCRCGFNRCTVPAVAAISRGYDTPFTQRKSALIAGCLSLRMNTCQNPNDFYLILNRFVTTYPQLQSSSVTVLIQTSTCNFIHSSGNHIDQNTKPRLSATGRSESARATSHWMSILFWRMREFSL